MRDLATIAAEEQTKRGALKAVTLAIANTEDTLARKCAERDALLAELRALKGESDAAWERTFAIADTEANPVAVEEPELARFSTASPDRAVVCTRSDIFTQAKREMEQIEF